MSLVAKTYAALDKRSQTRLQQNLGGTIGGLEKYKFQPEVDTLHYPVNEPAPDKVLRLLAETKDLVRKENGRDLKRSIYEFYDRHYKKIVAGMGLIALGATVSSGMLAAVSLAALPATATAKLGLMGSIVHVATPVLATTLAGAGLTNLIIRAGYFIDCNGKFQEARRGRDTFLEAMVKLGIFEKINEIKESKKQVSSSPRRELDSKLLRKIEKEIAGTTKYMKKMQKRDSKQMQREAKEAGRQPSNFRRSVQAEKLAKGEFDAIGLSDYFSYFVKPNEQLLSTNAVRKSTAEPKTPLQKACTKMQTEIANPTFPNLHNATVGAVQNFLTEYSTTHDDSVAEAEAITRSAVQYETDQPGSNQRQTPRLSKESTKSNWLYSQPSTQNTIPSSLIEQQLNMLERDLTTNRGQQLKRVQQPVAQRNKLQAIAKGTRRVTETAQLIKDHPRLWREILEATMEEMTKKQSKYELAR